MPKKTAKHRAELTPKQHRFVLAYLACANATKAALEAGYSSITAHVQGNRLLQNDKVKQAIIKRSEVVADKVEIKVEDIIAELMRLAFTDRSQAYNLDGSLKPIDDWPDALKSCFAGMGTDKFGRPAAQWEAKMPAINSLARHLPGFFKDKLNVEVSGEISIQAIKQYMAERQPDEPMLKSNEPKQIEVLDADYTKAERDD